MADETDGERADRLEAECEELTEEIQMLRHHLRKGLLAAKEVIEQWERTVG